MSTTVPPWAAADSYAAALHTGRGPLFLRRADGWLLPLEVERWCERADAVDLDVLDRCEGTVLDVGCGPGRLVAELAARGRTVLGIDVSKAAVDHTVRLGGRAVRRSVFEPLPDEGGWGTVLLMDGNIGIGGDPPALLDRVAGLLRPRGLLLAETAPVDVDERVHVHLTDTPAAAPVPVPAAPGAGGAGAPFPWARLGTPALLRYARGWEHAGQWSAGGRGFLALRSRGATGGAEPLEETAPVSGRTPPAALRECRDL